MKSGSDSSGAAFMQKDEQKETTGILENNQPISKQNLPASDHNNEVIESLLPNNGPSETFSADPTLVEAQQMQKISEEDAKLELESASPEDDQPQPDQMKANSPYTSRSGHVGNDNSDSEKTESVSPSAGSESSVGDGTAAQQTTSSHVSPLIMEPTQSFSLALAEKIPQNGSYESATQSSYSIHESSSSQANQLNTQTGSSLQAELLQPQRVEPVNKGKEILLADEFKKNKYGNNHLNENQPSLHYPNLFPQNPSVIRFLNGESTQINQQQQQQQQAPTWFSNKENDLYRHLAPESQVNQFKATNISDPFCYNFMLPTSSRPQQLASRPNASGSLLQNSGLSKHSLPMELMTQQFSYQHSQVPWTLESYIPQTFSTMFHETSSMPLSSAQLPAHDSQASNQFSMIASLPQQHHHTSELSENSLMSRLQQGLLTQTTKPIAIHPSSETTILNSSSLLQGTAGSSVAPSPYHMEPIMSSHREQGTSGQRGHARSTVELGESSSFKRFRTELNMSQASSDEQVNSNPLSLLNEASSNSNIDSLIRNPRPMLNSVYDPMFEGIGLPIDPHLRLFAKYMG